VEIKQLRDLIALVGANGALVLALLWMGKLFLTSLIDHLSHIQEEMEKHTSLLKELLIYSKCDLAVSKKDG